MAEYKHKNPYVHPDPKNGMLNKVGNDGYSFDERDDDGPAPQVILPGSGRKNVPKPERAADDVAEYRANMAKAYLGLSVEDAEKLTDAEISDMALYAQEEAEDRGFDL